MAALTAVLAHRRVRYIPQLEMAECGAASLSMVLDYHGCSVPLVETRDACGVSRDGVSAAQILRAARGYGLTARGLKLAPKQLEELPLPAILHWEFNHFLVLENIDRRGALLVDPALGRRRVSRQQLDEAYTGVVLAFQPGDELPRRPYRSRSLARYFRVLGEQKSALVYLALTAVLLELLGLLFPAANQIMIDHVIRAGRATWFWAVALTLVTATLARFALEWVRGRVMVSLQTAVDTTLMTEFVQHLLSLPLPFFSQRSAGELMQRVEANSELREVSATIVMSGLDALTLLAYGGLMLAYDARLAALSLCVSASRLILVKLATQRMRQHAANLFALQGSESATVVEALSAPEVVRALGIEPLLSSRYDVRMSERLNAELGLARQSGALRCGMRLFDGATQALVLYFGGLAVVQGQMSLGVLSGFIVLANMIDEPLAALLKCVDRYLYAQAILTRVDDVLDTAPAPAGTRAPRQLRGEIRFDQVSFRHGPTGPWLFEELSFTIAPGEKIALVGRSGQGKSTIMKLLLGVLEPQAGRILFDGVPLAELDRQALAAQLGVVVQEPFLLDDTVEQNLKLRVPDARPEELERAAKLACVDAVIRALPHGYRTRLGGDSVRLSGGQRQRLAVARALVRSPRVLLLDEATSSLDLDTEAALHANLGTLGCTRVLIAHRLATVRDADRIMVIDEGRIAQQGSYDQLATQDGLFRELTQAGLP